MLFVSKAEAGKQEFNPVRLDLEVLCRTIIEEVLISINSSHRIAFSPEGDPDGFMIDERLVRYAINNLLHNAAKYSPPGSVIDFDLLCGADNVIFRIRDRGIGIPAEDQKRLFQSFYRGRNVGNISGTGLGLVIVRHAIKRHGGEVTLDSQEGVGTTVTVSLPAVR
jgi:signal transduction histidine kinase